jgi:hypothetical protein
MTNFAVGAIFGFLICVWAIETSPSVAVAALWQRLEQVQETSAAASQAYDAMQFRQKHQDHSEDGTAHAEAATYR